AVQVEIGDGYGVAELVGKAGEAGAEDEGGVDRGVAGAAADGGGGGGHCGHQGGGIALFARRGTPSLSLPTRGRVLHRVGGTILRKPQGGTSPLVGEAGRGDAESCTIIAPKTPGRRNAGAAGRGSAPVAPRRCRGRSRGYRDRRIRGCAGGS